jgi:uncharacterized UPF0160 family protein
MYHADDVLSTALLKIVFGSSLEIVRVNSLDNMVIEDDDIVFDIGGGHFDHHQADSEVRDNGVPYAAFGLLFREFSPKLGIHPWASDLMDKEFVQQMDMTDNGGQARYPNTLSALVSASFKAGRNFRDTVDLILPLLEDLISTYRDLSDQKTEVESLIDDSTQIFDGGDKHYDGRVFEGTNVKFVIGPSLRGPGVVLRSLDSLANPIVDVDGVEPIFIHKNRFTATYSNKEDALAAANASL